jgi:hypothetical protein
MKLLFSIIILTLLMAQISCNRDESGGAQAIVSLHNRTSESLASAQPMNVATPSHFGMKITAIYLAADIDEDGSNIGSTSMVYLNPDCPSISSCEPSDLNTYFELALPTSEVNAQVNAQARTISPGTYRYVRIEFCKFDQDSPAVRWSEDNGTTYRYGSHGGCTTNSNIFDPPLAVDEGDVVTVTLSYDYENIISDSGGSICDNGRCLSVPDFEPSATKN